MDYVIQPKNIAKVLQNGVDHLVRQTQALLRIVAKTSQYLCTAEETGHQAIDKLKEWTVQIMDKEYAQRITRKRMSDHEPAHESLLLSHSIGLADQELSRFPYVQSVAEVRCQHRTSEIPVADRVPDSTAAEDLNLVLREVGNSAAISPSLC